MPYRTDLAFLQRLLKNMQIDVHIFSETAPTPVVLDRGLRNSLHLQMQDDRLFTSPWEIVPPHTIYKVQDVFFCRYCFVLLPNTAERTVLAAGPYLAAEITEAALLELAERYGVPVHIASQAEKYFGNLPLFTEESFLETLWNTLGETLWGSLDNFTVQTVTGTVTEEKIAQLVQGFPAKSDEALLAVQSLERRYDAERRFMQAVSQGMAHKAEPLIANASKLLLEQRTPDALRNTKNYCIIMNTLLRKSAEYGSVHPFYIDSVSSDFAKRIERVQSPEEFPALQREMVNTYCALVKSESTTVNTFCTSGEYCLVECCLTSAQ